MQRQFLVAADRSWIATDMPSTVPVVANDSPSRKAARTSCYNLEAEDDEMITT